MTNDAKRRLYGLPPVHTPDIRPLIESERENHHDIVIRDADGRAVKHFVPMVKNGFIFWMEVLNLPSTETEETTA